MGNGDCNSVIGLERHFCKVKTGNFPHKSTKIQNWVLADDPAEDPGLPRVDESGRKAGTAKTVDLVGGVKLELVCAYVSGGWAWNRSSGFRVVMEE